MDENRAISIMSQWVFVLKRLIVIVGLIIAVKGYMVLWQAVESVGGILFIEFLMPVGIISLVLALMLMGSFRLLKQNITWNIFIIVLLSAVFFGPGLVVFALNDVVLTLIYILIGFSLFFFPWLLRIYLEARSASSIKA